MGKNGLEGKVDLPPGFRFFPTDEELVVQYLSKKVVSHPLPAFIIGEVDLYKYDPWQLPEKALFGEKEWYFFTPRDRKYPNGSRPNRAAGSGYWKATGADKPITTCGGKKRVGVKKALVFYKGKAPKGSKTNWIMHEYRLAEINMAARKKNTLRLDDWVLCRIYNKKSSAEKLAERKMMEATPAKEEDMPNTEDPKDDRNTMQTVLSEPSHDASTGRPGLASSSITGVVSSLPMNLGSEYQNPFYQQSAMNTPYNPARSSPAAAPSHQLNCNSIGGHATTNYGGSIASNLPSLIMAEKDEVQSNFKLGNPVQKHEQGQGQGQSVQTGSPSFNFNFNGDGLQNPNFFSLDQTEASLKHPYQDFIDSIYNLQRGYQPSDMMLH